MNDGAWGTPNDPGGSPTPWGHDDGWEIEAGVVRPYVFTRGRTHAPGQSLAIETLVEATERGRATAPRLPPERRNIIELCPSPQSIAEVAARLGTPLGIARVLVAELAGDRLLQVYDHSDLPADLHLLQRLIAKVKAIPA